MSDDIREALNAAFDGTIDATPAPEAEAPDTVEPPAEAAPEAPEVEPKEEGRTRDEKGRFKAKEESPEEGKSATPEPTPAEPTGTEPPKPAVQTQTAPELKAPQSWKPDVREKWATVPEEVRREVLRREKEIATALQDSSEPRKFHQQFQQVMSPYAGMLAAEGLQPLQVVDSLMRTAAALRTAPPAHKAALIANMVKSYGVDIDALDAALSGEAPPQGQQQPQAPAQYRDPRLDALMMRAQQQRQEKLASELSTFATKAEFIEDVRQDMADLLEVAHKRGVDMSLEEAYNRACLLNPEVSKVLEQRKAAEAVANATASTQRAKAASSSVKSSPAVPAGENKPEGLRAMLEAAWEEQASG